MPTSGCLHCLLHLAQQLRQLLFLYLSHLTLQAQSHFPFDVPGQPLFVGICIVHCFFLASLNHSKLKIHPQMLRTCLVRSGWIKFRCSLEIVVVTVLVLDLVVVVPLRLEHEIVCCRRTVVETRFPSFANTLPFLPLVVPGDLLTMVPPIGRTSEALIGPHCEGTMSCKCLLVSRHCWVCDVM